jgi:hypothetical protein
VICGECWIELGEPFTCREASHECRSGCLLPAALQGYEGEGMASMGGIGIDEDAESGTGQDCAQLALAGI